MSPGAASDCEHLRSFPMFVAFGRRARVPSRAWSRFPASSDALARRRNLSVPGHAHRPLQRPSILWKRRPWYDSAGSSRSNNALFARRCARTHRRALAFPRRCLRLLASSWAALRQHQLVLSFWAMKDRPSVMLLIGDFVPVVIAGCPASSGAPDPFISIHSAVMPTSPRGSIV